MNMTKSLRMNNAPTAIRNGCAQALKLDTDEDWFLLSPQRFSWPLNESLTTFRRSTNVSFEDSSSFD
jgi:hypothetical protein